MANSITDEAFLALWRATRETREAEETRLRAVESKPSRAEVAGAVEVVNALPAAGQAGRMMGQKGNVFVDSGSAFFPIGRMLGFTQYRPNPGWSTTSVTFDEAFPGVFYLDFTPSGTIAYLQCLATLHVFVNPPNSALGYRTLLLDGANLGDSTYGLGTIEIGPAYPLTGSTVSLREYSTIARATGLTPGQTYRLSLALRASNGSYPATMAANRTETLMAWEA